MRSFLLFAALIVSLVAPAGYIQHYGGSGSGGGGGVTGPGSSTLYGVPVFGGAGGNSLLDSVLSGKGLLVSPGDGVDAPAPSNFGLAFSGSIMNSPGTTGWKVVPVGAIDFLENYVQGVNISQSRGTSLPTITYESAVNIRPDTGNNGTNFGGGANSFRGAFYNFLSLGGNANNSGTSTRKFLIYDNFQSAGGTQPGPGIGFNSATGSEWYFGSIDKTLGQYRENFNLSYDNTVTTISAPPNSVADASNAVGLTLKGANKTAGTGNGGNTTIDVGTSFGGTPGKIIFPSMTASTVPYFDASKNLLSSAVTPTQLGFLDATSSIQTQLNAKATLSGLTTNGVIYATSSSAVASTATGNAGNILTSNGAGAVPTFQAPAAAGVTGTWTSINNLVTTNGANAAQDSSVLIGADVHDFGIQTSTLGGSSIGAEYNWSITDRINITGGRNVWIGGAGGIGVQGSFNTMLGQSMNNFSANLPGSHNVGVGYGGFTTISSGSYNTQIGGMNPSVGVLTTGTANVLIGYDSDVATPSTSNTGVIGAYGTQGIGFLTDIFLGYGMETAPANMGTLTLHTTDAASGTDQSAATSVFKIAGGAGRGTGTGAPVVIQTAPAGSTGSTKNGLVDRFKIDQSGNVITNASGSALATTATNGFTYVPTMAGVPTGVPASLPTGAAPMAVDTTNKKLCFYFGGAWECTAALTP